MPVGGRRINFQEVELNQSNGALGPIIVVGLAAAALVTVVLSVSRAPDTSPHHVLAPVPIVDPSTIPTAAAIEGQPIADSTASASHTFTYTPRPGEAPQHVYLAGDFNNWSSNQTELTRDGAHFAASPKLSDGVHFYKFVVDGNWLNDPASETSLEVPDNYGGKNSAVMVGLDARNLPAPVEGKINSSAVAFDPAEVRDCNVASTESLRLSLRTRADDVTDVSVLTLSPASETPMVKTDLKMGVDRFGTLVALPAPVTQLSYIFRLRKPGATLYVAGGKAYTTQATAEAMAYSVSMDPKFQTPDWAKHAVWYQIFPERFRNGDPSNDPPNTQAWTSKWFDKHPGETGEFYRDVWARRYGGDFQGIREKLPYLRSLGVNAIYLNPIFEAEDLHKYDTSDYRHVDEHFGVKGDIEQLVGETEDPATWQWTASDKIFLDFLADAHRQGFKVIIDGVFNHVGKKFWAFQDVIKNGKNSKYAGWFDITDWTPTATLPFHYHAWDGDNGYLPALKKDAALGIVHGPREHLFAITRRWLAPDGDPARGVDGIRLDAPENIPHLFWQQWRTLVKNIKPDAYIDGEIWGPAQDYLAGDQYDGVMNYQFAIASQQFFVNQRNAISCTALNSRANELIFNYPFQAVLVNQNLFDSHDTDRVASMFVNPDLNYDAANRIQDNGPKYSGTKPDAVQRQRMLQEVAWQLSFVGAPMIYYGDETGMWSPDDPSNRQPMLWKDLGQYEDPQLQFDQGKFDWYRRLVAVRKKLPQLRTGFYRPVQLDDVRNTLVYARDLGRHHAWIVLNHADHEQTINFSVGTADTKLINWLADGSSSKLDFTDAIDSRPGLTNPAEPTLTAASGNVQLTLPAYGTAILSEATLKEADSAPIGKIP